jgi:hypothetical protein
MDRFPFGKSTEQHVFEELKDATLSDTIKRTAAK